MAWMAEITSDQAVELRGLQWTGGNYYNPIQIGSAWYISEVEVIESMSDELRWVRRLPLKNIEVSELQFSPEGAYYRRSLEIDADGNYTIESNLNPVLQDGTILTKDNHDQYDGEEGWQWYAAGEMVDLKVTPTR